MAANNKIKRGILITAATAAVIGAVPLTEAGAADVAPSASAAGALKGTFRVGAGSYFRMRFPTGGKFFKNPDSASRDKTYTSLKGGSAGGLVTGALQSGSGFDRRGNSRAGSIVKPTKFAGISFGLATFGRDPQSHKGKPRPSFTLSGTRIHGQVSALTAAWNKLYFNQGASVSGTYNPRTKSYTLSWSSKIHGGPFNGFTGIWRLKGKFARR